VIRILPILMLLAALLGCERVSPPVPTPTPAPVSWTPERIAADPEGYLRHAQKSVVEQVRLREQKLAELGRRRSEIEVKSDDMLRRVEEARNLGRRLESAIERAEDEDRWPLQFAGRSFSRERANSLRTAIQQFQEQRSPLADAYRDAVQRIGQSERALRADISNLGQVGQRLALDLERVRLNQGLAELTALRKTESELANFSSQLSALTDDPLNGLVIGGEEGADLNDLLKD
jgi:DNA repair exonuclease SbcCD ATPase subunit